MSRHPSLTPRIIEADRAFFIIDKPAGWPTLSVGRGEERTVASWLLAGFPEQRERFQKAPDAGICHRLDNETSGILLAARTEEAYDQIRSQFQAGTIEKHYQALVLGWTQSEGTCDLPIAHHPRKRKKMIICESEERRQTLKGRPASTTYHQLARYLLKQKGPGTSRSAYTLIDVLIETGVRHQIRVHLAHAGHPLAGDRLYQNAQKQREDQLHLDRHFLHCTEISFNHPVTGSRVRVRSPLPDELTAILNGLTSLS